MTQKDVRDFFHQRRTISLSAMRWIQDYQSPAVGQRPRTCASRPFIHGRAQQMLARFGRQSLDAVEIDHQQPGETSQRERIEGLIFGDAGEFTQAHCSQLELFSLF